MVETIEGDEFATQRNFTLKKVNFGVFSVAKDAAVTGTCP